MSLHRPSPIDLIPLAMTVLRAGGDLFTAAQEAETRFGETSRIASILKAAVAGGALEAGGNWGSQLASLAQMGNEFFELVSKRTIRGQLNARRAPFRIKLISVTSGASAEWVSEGKVKPISRMVFADEKLVEKKIAATVMVSDELMNASDVRAENWLTEELRRALVEEEDAAFIDPTIAGDASTPASILDGAISIPSTGDADNDILNLIGDFIGDLSTSVFVMSPYAGAQLHGAENPLIGARGGEVRGVPAITSESVPDGLVALIDSEGVVTNDTGIGIQTTRQASVAMVDASSPPETQMVNLWQVNAMALRVERFVNWMPIRSGSALYIENASWAVPSAIT